MYCAQQWQAAATKIRVFDDEGFCDVAELELSFSSSFRQDPNRPDCPSRGTPFSA